MHMSVRFALVASAALFASAARAQSVGNVAGALALQVTPTAGLPVLVSRAMIGGPASKGPQFAVRYGHTGIGTEPSGGDVNVDNYGLTGLVPMGEAGTLYATVGADKLDCDGCKTQFMLSGGGDIALGGRALSTSQNSARMTFTMSGELGYSHQNGGYAVSGLVSLPVALVFPNGTLRVAPFLSPGFGYGRAHDNNPGVGQSADQSAGRFVLSGGLGVVDVNSIVGVTIGFSKVFVSESFDEPFFGTIKLKSKMLFGIGLTVGR